MLDNPHERYSLLCKWVTEVECFKWQLYDGLQSEHSSSGVFFKKCGFTYQICCVMREGCWIIFIS